MDNQSVSHKIWENYKSNSTRKLNKPKNRILNKPIEKVADKPAEKEVFKNTSSIVLEKKNEFSNKEEPSNKESSNKDSFVKKRKNNLLLAVSIIVGVLLLLFVIQPAILGLSVYEDTNTTKLADFGGTLALLNEKIDAGNTQLCEDLQLQFEDKISELELKTTELNEKSSKLVGCLAEKSALDGNSNLYEKNIDSLEVMLEEKEAELEEARNEKEAEIVALKKELEDLQGSNTVLVKNMANNICCKQKVDDSSINSYTIEGEKVVCSSSGENALSCF